MSGGAVNLGHFAVFGISNRGEAFIQQHTSERLGIQPKVVDYGSSGRLFFYNSYGDFVQTETYAVLKSGFLRDTNHNPLSTQQIIEQKMFQPDGLKDETIEGGGLLASFSKTNPQFCVYQTLFISPVLYYTKWGEDGILCTTDIRCLTALLDDVALNENAALLHLLFHASIGPQTYYQDIYRLSPGHCLTWNDGQLGIKLIRRLDATSGKPKFDSVDEQSVEALYQGMNSVVAGYLQDIRGQGGQTANLLSGGVDSSILQLLLNNHLGSDPRLSYSYSVQSQEFDFEQEYAQHASELFETEHAYFEITPDSFPDLLIRTIQILGQPNVLFEGDVGKFVMAEALATNAPKMGYYFGGQGADALFGLAPAKKMLLLDRTRHVPGASLGFQLLSLLASPISRQKAHGFQEVAELLRSIQKGKPFGHPLNKFGVTVDLDRMRRFFGDQAILQSMAYRLELEQQYLTSDLIVENMQTIDLLSISYEPALIAEQIFAAHGKTLIQPFLDQEVVAMAYAIHPKVRYVSGVTVKPFLKEVLTRQGFGIISNKKKGAQLFRRDVYNWMRRGPLADLVQSIDRPDTMSSNDFAEMLAQGDKLVWNMLTLDIFKKYVLRNVN